MPLHVLIAEDHALVRAGFHALLNGLDGIQIIAEADSKDPRRKQ